MDLLDSVLKLCGDKEKEVRQMAEIAGPTVMKNLPTYAVKAVVPKLLASMDNSCKAPTVVGALALLEKLAEKAPIQVCGLCLCRLDARNSYMGIQTRNSQCWSRIWHLHIHMPLCSALVPCLQTNQMRQIIL